MALTHFSFGITPKDEDAPAFTARSATCEGIAPTSTSAATTASVPATFGNRQPLVRVATDTAVYVSFGTSPNATSDTVRFFLPANCVEYFYVLSGHKAAVVTI